MDDQCSGFIAMVDDRTGSLKVNDVQVAGQSEIHCRKFAVG